MTADDQQERLEARWVTGFVDGEGCFHVSINKVPKMSIGWQVLPEFRIVQHERDESVLEDLRRFFNAGKVVVNHGARKELRIRKLEQLKDVVLFFKQYPLKTRKGFGNLRRHFGNDGTQRASDRGRPDKDCKSLLGNESKGETALLRILRDYTPEIANSAIKI